MRSKRPRVILTFPTTTAAIAMEKACMNCGAPGRLIPVPREITAGCGMAWAAAPEEKELLLAVAEKNGITWEKAVEIMV